jgi:hypothetical protein
MRTTGNYRLANNIDASATAQTPFVPIGTSKDFFRGTLDGYNYTINNLTITGSTNTGIFMRAYNAVLKNIRLTNVIVTGGTNTGAIAGYVENVDFTNSYVTGTVTGNAQGFNIGLAFGAAGSWTRVARCYTVGTVNGKGTHMGGLIGYAASYGFPTTTDDPRIMIDEVFTQATISPTTAGAGTINSGGIIGTLIGGSINNVNAVGNITGKNAAGGLIGNIINNDPNSMGSYIRGGLSRGTVTDAATANRTGAIGMMTGSLIWTGGAYYDKDTDTGVPNPNISDPACQVGFTSNQLKAPVLSPTKLFTPYIYGALVTQQAINQGIYQQCQLSSGSDGDWGFGTCSQTALWTPNSNSQYNTLLRIPNPSVQPK